MNVLSSIERAPVKPAECIDHPSGYIALGARNRRFTLPGLPGFIGYRRQGMHWFSLGGVHAPERARPELLDGFLSAARRCRRNVVAVELRENQTELFRSRGFTVNPLGSSYALRLPGFSYAGTRRMKVRQKIKQARNAGLRVLEVGRDVPADEKTFSGLHHISTAWLQAKGGKELDFLIGELGGPDDVERRIFVAVDGIGKWVGFISCVPVWGRLAGYMQDLTRRLPEAPVGTMELCAATAVERFIGEGVEHLHLGLAPFVVSGAAGPGSSGLLAWLIDKLYRHGSFIYPSRNQLSYKLKWAPDVIEPEYIAFRPVSLRGFLDLLLVTGSI